MFESQTFAACSSAKEIKETRSCSSKQQKVQDAEKNKMKLI